jgi:hypothetical protein
MSAKWKEGKDNYITSEDKDSPYGKAKKPSKVAPAESKPKEEGKRKKLKKGSMLEKIVKGYAKGM